MELGIIDVLDLEPTILVVPTAFNQVPGCLVPQKTRADANISYLNKNIRATDAEAYTSNCRRSKISHKL